MKKSIFIQLVAAILFLATNHINSFAQTRDDIFKQETPVTWLGVDFSESRYLGDQGTVSGDEMKYLFSKINYLILSEPDKYNLHKTFSKFNITPNIEMVEKVNGNIDASKIVSYNYAEFNRLDTAKIQDIVSNYKIENVKGLALIFIMEGMNKSSETGSMWVTFINVDNKKVLHTVRITGKAGGFGFRNHWAATINDVMKKIYTKEYKNWQSASTR